ncbi:flagellar basal body-associated protein FliL [Vibrio sp.]|uniref:flagellar basal body-associated protein FliL n=1 Tax=Vibrio sp. TaxID=678 RepID=UPI00287274E7|nr:flagellar basal body-associated FliL family protein [Vibrio sp. FNV 38]
MINLNHPGVKVLLAGFAAAALIVGAAGGTYYMLSNNLADGESFFPSAQPESQVHFMSLDKFIISLNGEERMHYLLLELDLKTMNTQAHEELISFRPVVNNVLLKMFSQMSYEEMRELSDIEALQHQVKSQLTNTLQKNGYQHAINDVLFTKLVLQ